MASLIKYPSSISLHRGESPQRCKQISALGSSWSDSSSPIAKTLTAWPFEAMIGATVKSKRKYFSAWQNG
ncbi:MAG TPA: hypothetical protein DGO89_22875 [Microcoleaceae bacterium UBA9251]|nr:hypothetical protein [Microcoleaceae cyanobacterium UBA9251]